ncbi:putative fungal-specific transcription factor [Amylocarpus encephaloides]|uniref:Fungal-specific transcription factor n=1 Tax=Amylocarpus encephaloides TaxID=45428 RepID=A0A9P7YNX2_9HELO|nr:putative fungal-specific transcription factor [Amylocarpus encephaloides]
MANRSTYPTMNVLSDQVSDLAYLAESPMAASPYSNLTNRMSDVQERRQSSSGDSAADSGRKRKADHDGNDGNNGSNNGVATNNVNGNGVQHTRTKRNRYISIACNECKRRKIKCNGQTPCIRCGNLSLNCEYAPNCCTNGFKDSEEFRQMNTQLASLQEQVDALYSNLNSLRTNGDGMTLAASSERSMSMSQAAATPQPISPTSRYRPRHPSYRGPTSSAFSLDVAKNTLHNMGYQGLNADDGTNTQDPTPMPSPQSLPAPPIPAPESAPCRDPIWQLGKEEMIRLCRVYEEEMGIMYPVVDIEQVITSGTNLYAFVHATQRHGIFSADLLGKGITDEQACVLKMVLACSTLTERHGKSELAYMLFDSVKEKADGILHGEAVEVHNLPFLVLVAIYHFHCDEEALAWRIIGQVARICIELGLHRRESLFKVVVDEEERANAINLFWSIYVLDRRWSFGTGMPFALQDADIDPNLPEPELNIPYLNVMIIYSRIGSKVWRSVCSFTPTPNLNLEDIGYLDYQILQWQKAIPAELQLPTTSSPPTSSRAIQRLQILLYLRANQMRILIYRPVLHSASSIQENLSYASTVVDLAKDTIHALTHLNQTSDIYRCQQVCFNYFLTSAIAVVFLASCHAPVHFSGICKDEFYMGLDLVKGFSNKSWVSKRLWKTIKGLKEVGPKLGLAPNNSNNHEDPHSSAALAMAGLAGHEISNLGSAYGQDNGGLSGLGSAGKGNSPNGYQMSHDMISLFEAALGRPGANGYVMQEGSDVVGNGMGSNVFGGDEVLYQQMRGLF